MINYFNKYLKYKKKYNNLKLIGGTSENIKYRSLLAPILSTYNLYFTEKYETLSNNEYKKYILYNNNIIFILLGENHYSIQNPQIISLIFKSITQFITDYKCYLFLEHFDINDINDINDNLYNDLLKKYEINIEIENNNSIIKKLYNCIKENTFYFDMRYKINDLFHYNYINLYNYVIPIHYVLKNHIN